MNIFSPNKPLGQNPGVYPSSVNDGLKFSSTKYKLPIAFWNYEILSKIFKILKL